MAERKTIHISRANAFQRYLLSRGAVEVVPKVNEAARYLTSHGIVSFGKRKNSDHITTYGIGTELARQFIKSKGVVNEQDLIPVSKSGSDESKTRRA